MSGISGSSHLSPNLLFSLIKGNQYKTDCSNEMYNIHLQLQLTRNVISPSNVKPTFPCPMPRCPRKITFGLKTKP